MKKTIVFCFMFIILVFNFSYANNWVVSENALFYEEANETMLDGAISSLASSLGKTKRYLNSRLIIKDEEDLLDELYTHVYPGSAMMFESNEIYCLKGESLSTEDTGKIIFIVRNKDNVDLVYPNINYDLYPNGIYEPCICSYTDDTIFLSGYTYDENDEYVSILMILDEDFNVTSKTTIPGAKFCGNTLVTPQGFVIHLSCENGISLYRSSTVINNSVDGILFKNICTIDSDDGAQNGNICSYNGKVLALYNDKYNAVKCSVSKNPEGVGKWDVSRVIAKDMYFPIIPLSSTNNDIPFSATVISDEYSYPIVGFFDFSEMKLKDIYDFDNRLYGIAGNICFLQHKDGYGYVYYETFDEKNCTVFLKDIKSNFKDSIPTSLDISSDEAEKLLFTFPSEKGTSIGKCNMINFLFDYNKNLKKLLLKYNYQNYQVYEFGLNSKTDSFVISDDDLENVKTIAKLCGYSFNFNSKNTVIGKDGKFYNFIIDEKNGYYSKKQVDNLVAYMLRNSYEEYTASSFDDSNMISRKNMGSIYVGYKVENNYAIRVMAYSENVNISKITYCIDGKEVVVTEPLKNIRISHDGEIHNVLITAYGGNGNKVEIVYNYK